MRYFDNLEQHELAKIFPAMSAVEKKALVEDIRENGLLQKIHMFEGKIIDGWHRYQACLKAGVTPQCDPMPWKDPVAFVLSANLYRTHRVLTAKQRKGIVLQASMWNLKKLSHRR